MSKIVVAALALCLPAFAPQQVEQKNVDAAIKKGADFILKTYAKGITEENPLYELVMYTLIHADVDPSKSSVVKKGVDKLISLEPTDFGGRPVYRVAVQALALHSLLLKSERSPNYSYLKKRSDAIQKRIALCGQYLVDSQCENGQWTYLGASLNKPKQQKLITTGGSSDALEEKKKKVPGGIENAGSKLAWENAVHLTGTIYLLKSKKEGGKDAGSGVGQGEAAAAKSGDNSNTQYGILGLIAAQMSGCVVPEETWKLSLAWFEQCQGADGGFGYAGIKGKSYGSMTTAGLVALAACYRYIGKGGNDEKNAQQELMKQPKVASAVKWLADNFTVSDNPQNPGLAIFYYLYGLERCGAFLETENMGAHKWYDEGAEWLIKNQQADGAWGTSWNPAAKSAGGWDFASLNACFAILFLKRATSEIIETGSGGGQPPIIEQKR